VSLESSNLAETGKDESRDVLCVGVVPVIAVVYVSPAIADADQRLTEVVSHLFVISDGLCYCFKGFTRAAHR